MFAKLLAVLTRKMKPGATYTSEDNSLTVTQMRPTLWGQFRHGCFYPKWVVTLRGDNWNGEWKIGKEVMKGDGHQYEIGTDTTITGYGYRRRLSLSWTGNVKSFNLDSNEILFLTPNQEILTTDGKRLGHPVINTPVAAS